MRYFGSLLFLLICLVSLSGFTFGQKRERQRNFSAYAEYYTDGDSNQITVVFRVQNKALIFIKDGESYRARFSVQIEASDSAATEFAREIREYSVSASSLALSKSDSAVVSLLKVTANIHPFSLRITFIDVNTQKEIRQINYRLGLNPGKPNRLKGEKVHIGQTGVYVIDENAKSDVFNLTNFDGCIPFNNKPHGLLIKGKTLSSKTNVILKSSDSNFVFHADTVLQGHIAILEYNNSPAVKFLADTAGEVYYFVKDVATSLIPGSYSIQLATGKDTLNMPGLIGDVWINIPESLQDPSIAWKLLTIIDVNVDSLIDIKPKNKSLLSYLFAYWKKLDPTPKTAYNEVMAEFYARTDFANSFFSTIRANDGLNTDRGRMYVRFGRPAKLRRVTSAEGKQGEVWTYQDGTEYYFVDISGTGNYELVKAL